MHYQTYVPQEYVMWNIPGLQTFQLSITYNFFFINYYFQTLGKAHATSFRQTKSVGIFKFRNMFEEAAVNCSISDNDHTHMQDTYLFITENLFIPIL